MDNLKLNLFSKSKLKFKNGRFRILTVSDFHGVYNFDKRLVRDLDAIVEALNPDIVLLLGDQVWRDAMDSEEHFKFFISHAVEPMEKRKIPWAHVYGNHDSYVNVKTFSMERIYESFDCCLSKAGPDNVAGVSNWVLPVYSEDEQKIVYNIWGLDSHDTLTDYINEFDLNKDPWFYKFPDYTGPYGNYDTFRFSQIMWYWNASEELNLLNGSKIPGIMTFHMPFPEYSVLYRNPAQTKYKGIMRESCGNGPFNSGLFNVLVERGEVKTVICGHDHINDYEGTLCGIKLAYDAALNYDGYCDDDLRGGRIIDIRESDPYNADTYLVRASDYVSDYPGTCERYFD